MAGHSHWAGIKHKKGIADQKRGRLFAKLLSAISVAAKSEANPEFNPRLRTAIEKAKDASVPQEKIESAIKRASETGQNLEDLLFGAYGPGGAAILIEAVSDNKNRTVAEIKKVLSDAGGKWSEIGSVEWAFSAEGEPASGGEYNRWKIKFRQELNEQDKNSLAALVKALKEHDDVQEVYTNAK